MPSSNSPDQFRGKNTLNSKMAYYYRLLYDVMTNPQVSTYKSLKPNVTNYEYGERVMYGRIDRSNVAMIPKENLLIEPRKTRQSEKLVRNLNFVVDAYNAFLREFQRAITGHRIGPDEGWLSVPIGVKGYVSPTTHYAEYRSAVFQLFMTYLEEHRLHKKITDFDSFLVYFMSFVRENSKNIPFTLESYTRSKLGEPHFQVSQLTLITRIHLKIWKILKCTKTSIMRSTKTPPSATALL